MVILACFDVSVNYCSDFGNQYENVTKNSRQNGAVSQLYLSQAYTQMTLYIITETLAHSWFLLLHSQQLRNGIHLDL